MKTPTRGRRGNLLYFLLFGLFSLSLVNCHNIGSVGEVLLDENERYKDVHQIWKIEEVEKIEWTSSSSFAEEMTKRTTPVILRNTNASTNWAPMSWSYESLMTTLGEERKIPVHELKQHTMMLFRNFPEFGSWPGTNQIYETKEYTIRQLINELKKSTAASPSTSKKASNGRKHEEEGHEEEGHEEEEMEEVILEKTFLYAPFDIIESFSPVLFNVIQPTSFFNVKPKPRKSGEAPPKQHVTLWLGSAGVTTQIHFDLDENFHLQIKGNKRFLLVPPTEHNKLYLHSRIHPR
jgi:hypothetical protein